jgi:hypothetical protein
MAFTHTQKVNIESFIKARIRSSGPRRPDPDPQHWCGSGLLGQNWKRTSGTGSWFLGITLHIFVWINNIKIVEIHSAELFGSWIVFYNLFNKNYIWANRYQIPSFLSLGPQYDKNHPDPCITLVKTLKNVGFLFK